MRNSAAHTGRCTAAGSRRAFGAKLIGGLGTVAGLAVVRPTGTVAADDPTATPGKPMIFDLHVHMSRLPGDTPTECMNAVMEYADRMGIDRVLVYLGLPPTLPDPSPADIRRKNDQTLEALSGWPDRALGLVYLNPKHGKFALAEFNRCVRQGPMVGVKLWIARHCSAPELDPIVAQAAELQALVYQHTWLKVMGNTPGESTPMDVAALARRHPTARLVCGHAGGDWERGIRAIRDVENVSLGVAGSEPTAGFIEMAVRELGAHRVLYGSDVGGRSFASQLAKVLGADVSDDAKRLILGENLRRLLEPIVRTKNS